MIWKMFSDKQLPTSSQATDGKSGVLVRRAREKCGEKTRRRAV